MYEQIIYRSRYQPTGSGATSTLHSIVAASEYNNGRDRITGYLVFDKTFFMQILEGDAADVQHAYDRIAKDPRHTELTLLYRGNAEKRAFPEWSMGGVVRSPEMQDIFARHGYLHSFEEAPTGDQFIALAREIADLEVQRQQQRGLSTR